ncbi:hypothetical protein J2X63_001725 [Agromyces sp. 3263]|nr:hypothetical protein [Agromyces sp. 3263]
MQGYLHRMTPELVPVIAAAALAVSLSIGVIAHRLRPQPVRVRAQSRPVNRSIER